MAITIRGIKFPFQRGSKGIPAEANDAEAVKSDLFLLLKTNTRTRVMKPRHGLDLPTLVFENTGAFLRAKILRIIAEGIGRFEPRVRLADIRIEEKGTKVTVDIDYEIMGLQDTLGMNIDRETGVIKRNGN